MWGESIQSPVPDLPRLGSSLSEVVSVQSFERCSVFQMEAFVGAVIFTAAL